MMIKFNFKTSGFNSIDFFVIYISFILQIYRIKICKFDDNINWLDIFIHILEFFKNVFKVDDL